MNQRLAILATCVAAAGCTVDRPTPTDVARTQPDSSLITAIQAQERLFTIVPAPQLNAEQLALVSTIRARSTTAEVYLAVLRTDAGLLLRSGKDLSLDVSPLIRFAATNGSARENPNGTLSWRGDIFPTGFGGVQLVLTGKGVTGTLRAGSAIYHFEPIGGGLHALIRAAAFPNGDDSPDGPSGGLQELRAAPTRDAPVQQVGLATTSVSPRIDVLVVYTQAVANAVADIQGLIQLAIDESNTSYANSSIALTVASVHSAQVTYTETGRTYAQHVAALQSISDGIMDNVHALRDQYSADVVVLLVSDFDDVPSLCGRASTIYANAASAFAAVRYDCATGNYSFAHEIGHLQGARHDRASDPTNTPFQYGHGYIDPSGQWRTIMATGAGCNDCLRVQYWSNPDVTYPPTGQAMGTTTYEDDARVLDETKVTVANFRSSLIVALTGPTYSVGHTNTCQWTATITGGTPPYTYTWSTWAGSPSAAFDIVSGQGTGNASTYSYYSLTNPPTTSAGIALDGSDAAGQPYALDRTIIMDNYPSGCRDLLAATWTGPTHVGHTDTCQWTATATGGTPPYYYYWSASWTSQSTGFYFTSGQGTPNASSYGYYYGTFPPTTDIRVSLGVSDAGGQVYNLERSIVMDNYPSGCR